MFPQKKAFLDVIQTNFVCDDSRVKLFAFQMCTCPHMTYPRPSTGNKCPPQAARPPSIEFLTHIEKFHVKVERVPKLQSTA